MLAPAERQRALNGPVPDEFVRLRVLALVAVGRCEQGDDPLARLDGGVVNGERFARSSGEPLGGGAVADHLIARHGHIDGRVCPHGGELIGMTQQLPQPVRDDLGHGFGAADEHAQHLGGHLDVVERAVVRQPVAQQTVHHRQRVVRSVGAPTLHRRDQVVEIVRPRLRGVDTAAGFGKAARIDRGKHL